jgi:alkaline phosphatase
MKYQSLLPRKAVRCLALLAVALLAPALDAENVILFIGDRMGNEHVKAARCYNGGPLSFEALPHQAQVTTHSANNSVTDSAASGTAIATGVKVNNYVVSLAIPGDGSELETSLELHQKLGRRTGLVTTTYLTHATPATFGAHETDRNNYSQIGLDYLNRSRPNILFGGGGNGLTPENTIAAGYSVATDSAAFNALNSATAYLSAQFGATYMPYEADYLTDTGSKVVVDNQARFRANGGGFGKALLVILPREWADNEPTSTLQ